MKTSKLLLVVLALSLLLGLAGASLAETPAFVPTQDIEFVVGNSAGGGADLFTRKVVSIITQYKLVPTNITVMNKPGSSHVVGYAYLLEKGGDHYLDVTSASFFTQPVSKNSPFTFDDFAYVSMLCKDPNLLFRATNAPFEDFEGMIAYAKEHPGEVMLAGSSAYSDDAIICYMIRDLFDVDITYVTYESGADVLAASMGGHVHLGILNPAEVGDNVLAGNVVGLAVSAQNRVSLPGMENIPTFKELGVDIAHQQPRGFVMAKNASPEAVKYYSDVMQQVVETPEWKEYLLEQCMEAAYSPSEVWGTTVKDEYIEVYTNYINIILNSAQ